MAVSITKDDLQVHVAILDRVIERFKAQAQPNPVAMEILGMLRQEYATIDQITPEIV